MIRGKGGSGNCVRMLSVTILKGGCVRMRGRMC